MSYHAFPFIGNGRHRGRWRDFGGGLGRCRICERRVLRACPEPVVEPKVAVAETVAVTPDVDPIAPKPALVESAPKTPSFDVVRVETDGTAMIAGNAEAGSVIEIRVDETVVAEVKADSSGNFASFVTLPESKDAQVLTLNK